MSHIVDTVPVTTLSSGHRVELHVHTVRGAGEGPTLGMVASVHGDEPMGVETVRRVLAALDPAALRGSVVAVPVANPYAHQALTRNTPLDGMNLNRIFPGSPTGTISEQLASALCGVFLGRADYLIDFHSGGNFACVDYCYIHDQGAELARAYGCELLFRGPSYAGSLADHARRQGLPSVVSELGGGQQRIAHYLAKGVRGAFNVLRHLGMVDGEVARPARQEVTDELVILQPRHGGLLLSEAGADRLGERVAAGTVLGRVLSPYTFEELEVLTAPFDPTILVLAREEYTTVAPGDYGFMVANGARTRPAA